MLAVDRPTDLLKHAGADLGVSGWHAIDQEMINSFADTTGDHQWIHVDVEKARREMPGGKTIAHGYLTLSLLPLLTKDLEAVKRKSRAINYGVNKVRFITPVPVGSRVRARQSIKAVDPVAGGVRVAYETTVEIEGQDKPAMVAENLVVMYD